MSNAGGYTGVCGSDLHLYFAPEAFAWDFSSPAELTGAAWPQILGHEFSGTMAAVRDGVTSVRAADRVAAFPYHHCRRCPACQAGDPASCALMAFEGIQGQSGEWPR
jgi:(R,R)-butanediol dehydrogenase/meso-butanediol dehydrogenase/diacetyl reductase